MRRFPRGVALLTLAATMGSAIAFSASTVIINFFAKYSSREQSSIRTKREGRGEGLLRSDLGRILLCCVKFQVSAAAYHIFPSMLSAYQA